MSEEYTVATEEELEYERTLAMLKLDRDAWEADCANLRAQNRDLLAALKRLFTAAGEAMIDDQLDGSELSQAHEQARAARDDDRRLDGAVEAVAGWLRGLGRLARQPQTGQLHQYYIQAVAVLALGVLLLVMVR